MATKGYNLEQTGEQVQAALNKAINLGPATEETDGLMTAADKASLENLNTEINDKVDKVTGKGLSTNDFTNEDKGKLDTAYQVPSTGIPAADLSSGVQTSLGKANSAVQPADLVPITEKIPAQASAQNQLADKAFVNSSISTASADFKGTYDSLAELQAVTADKNDYGYVVSTDEAGNTVYSRYKYNGSSWVFEYDLNNSSFTAAEWASIQSGITALLVQKLGALPTNADLQSALSGKQATLVSGTNIKTVDGQSILGSGNLSVSDPNAVKVTAQTWTDAQKTQARTNIGAVAASALSALETAIAAKYSKPSGGIPETDLASGVQSALALARTSIQSLTDYYSKTEVDALLDAVGSEQYVDVATLPTASASTLGKIYLVGPDANGFYDRYYTSYDGSTYSWVPAGNTEINLANYATKEELSQLQQKVTDLEDVLDIQNEEHILGLSATLYKQNFYIANGAQGTTLGQETAASGRAIFASPGWKKGDTIRISYLNGGGVASCSIAIYKNGEFVKNVLSGNGGVVISSSTDFTPEEDFDEVRFTATNSTPENIAGVKVENLVKSSVIDVLSENVDEINEALGIQEGIIQIAKSPALYKNGYYIGNGVGTTLGDEYPSAARAIYTSSGWKQGDVIRISYLKAGGASSCAIALYKGGVFIKNVLSGTGQGGVVISTTTDFTPEEDFDEVRFTLYSNDATNISNLICGRNGIVSLELSEIKEEIAELESPLKVLLIGSSFGVNTIIQFPFICKGANVNIICGNLYRGACTLADTVDIINGSKTWDTGRIFRPITGLWEVASTNFETMLKYTDWDVIIVQRGRNETLVWNTTMEQNFQTIVEYIRQKVTGTPEILINSIFADPVFSTDKTGQVNQTNTINSTAKQMQDAFGFEIIPVATAVQNARMTNLIGFGSVAQAIPDMAEDSIHLDTGIGSYVTAAVLFEYIIGKRFGKSIIANPYVPVKTDITSMGIFAETAYTQPTADNINVMKYCALLACRNQDTISMIIGTRYPYEG